MVDKFFKELTADTAKLKVYCRKAFEGCLQWIDDDNKVPSGLSKSETNWILSIVKLSGGVFAPYFFELKLKEEKQEYYPVYAGNTREEIEDAKIIGMKFYVLEEGSDFVNTVTVIKTDDDYFYLTKATCKMNSASTGLYHLFDTVTNIKVGYRAFCCDDLVGLKKLFSSLDWLK